MYKLGIVILNYITWEESVDCISSIERCHIEYEHLVIVDNASPNDSFKVLSKLYNHDDKIHVIRTEKNKGFARGNNYGIQFLKSKKVDFILLLNSDTVIQDKMYVKKMLQEYKSGIGLIGSKVKLKFGREQAEEYRDLSLKAVWLDFVELFCQVHYFYFMHPVRLKNDKSMWLHGCSLLLTPDYFKKYNCLWPYTFLYREELVLSIMLDKVKLRSAIADSYIYHKGGKSTELFFERRSLKRRKLELWGCFQELIVKLMPYNMIKMLIQVSK